MYLIHSYDLLCDQMLTQEFWTFFYFNLMHVRILNEHLCSWTLTWVNELLIDWLIGCWKQRLHGSKINFNWEEDWCLEYKYKILIFATKQSKRIWSTIILSKFFFLFIGREPTSWPPNNCLQLQWSAHAQCRPTVFGSSVWLQIIFCTCVKETVLFSSLRSLLRENSRSLRFPRIFIKKQTRWSNDKTIIELG